MGSKTRSLVGLVFAVFAGAGWSEPALGAGASQYLTHFRGGERERREIKVLNSTGVEMFALLVEYDEGKTFAGCNATLVPAKGNNYDKPLCCLGTHSHSELIAVPASGPFAGAVDVKFGVEAWRGSNWRPFLPQDPRKFKVSSAEVAACACDKLRGFGLSNKLLANFGITCP
jgi:hypothetical protein